MRMLEFKNSEETAPPGWVPADAATYITFHMDLKKAFHYSESLVDEYAGDKGVFKAMWENLAHDPSGPMIDIEKELIDHLGERVTLVSDVKIPVDLKSERLIVAIELLGPKSAAIVTKTLEKAFSKDKAAKKREFKGHVIWELMNDAAAEPDALRWKEWLPPLANPAAAETRRKRRGDGREAHPAEHGLHRGQRATLRGNARRVHGRGHRQEWNRSTDDQIQTSTFRISEALAAWERPRTASGSSPARTNPTAALMNSSNKGSCRRRKPCSPSCSTACLARAKREKSASRRSTAPKLPEFKQSQKYLGPAGSYVHSEEEAGSSSGCCSRRQPSK